MAQEWIGKTLWENRRAPDTDRLTTLIPSTGEVPFKGGNNIALEVFRAFTNAYYDLYNNGGCNWGSRGFGYRQAAKIYGFRIMGVRQLWHIVQTDQHHYCEELEQLGDIVIDRALKEQFGA